MPQLTLTSSLFEDLIGEARRAYPLEACGLLFGRADRIDQLQPARNVHPRPQTHFEIDPQALVDAHRSARQGGPDLLGYYHSHPRGSAEPSSTDRAHASGDGRIWAIVAGGDVTFWRDGEGGFAKLSYSADDG